MTNLAYDTERRSYYVTLRVPGEDGGAPRRRVKCYPTFEQALRALDLYKAGQMLSGGDQAGALTLGQWLTYWLEEVIAPTRAASTVHGYGTIIHNHVTPALGTIRLDRLTTAQIQRYLNRKQEEGLSNNTVRKHHGLLHNALEYACRQELVSVNAADRAVAPVFIHPEHHYYDSQTMSRLFAAVAGTSLEPIVKLAGYLGLRRSEICALKWKNVDREEKVVTIAEARTAVNGRSVDKGTKNASSVRRLGYRGLTDLDELLERLWRQREEEMARLGGAYQDRGFVICHDGGLPYQPDYVSNLLQRVLRENGLPYVTLHGLRHSFASIAHSCNVSLFGISRALGHSTTTTTTQIYMHLFDETHLSVVQQVGQAIDGALPAQGPAGGLSGG